MAASEVDKVRHRMVVPNCNGTALEGLAAESMTRVGAHVFSAEGTYFSDEVAGRKAKAKTHSNLEVQICKGGVPRGEAQPLRDPCRLRDGSRLCRSSQGQGLELMGEGAVEGRKLARASVVSTNGGDRQGGGGRP